MIATFMNTSKGDVLTWTHASYSVKVEVLKINMTYVLTEDIDGSKRQQYHATWAFFLHSGWIHEEDDMKI